MEEKDEFGEVLRELEEKLLQKYLDPDWIVENVSLDEFYYWCRVPEMDLDRNDLTVFNGVLRKFEEKEYYEYCAVLKTAREELKSGLMVFNEYPLGHYIRAFSL